MSKTVIFHGVAVIIIFAMVIWASMGVNETLEITDSMEEYEIESLKKENFKQEGIAMLKGALAFLVAGGYVAFLFIKYALPKITGAMSDFVFSDSSAQEEIEDEVMRTARMFYAQGEYEAAAEAFAQAAIKSPEERLPVIERAKVQLEKLENPAAAVATYEEALEGRAWEEEDATFFMFRIANLYREELNNPEAATAMLEKIMARFPGTRQAEKAMAQLRQKQD